MPNFVHLNVNGADCDFLVTCNGFPVYRHEGVDPFAFSGPINHYLVGKGNKLQVQFSRKGGNARFEAGISNLSAGDMADTSDASDISLPDGDSLEHSFDSDEDGFSALLAEATPADEKSMLDFAIKFRDALRGGDESGLLAPQRFRMEGAAKTYGMPIEVIKPQLMEMMKGLADGGANFEAGDIEALGWCDNRIWEIRRKDGNALLYKKEEDGSFSMPAFVAVLKDGPQLVD